MDTPINTRPISHAGNPIGISTKPISEEGADKDHFVHVSGLIDEINEGDEVEFELEEGRKGLNAVNVKVVA